MRFPIRRSICPTNPTQLPIGQSTFAIPASYKENQFSVNIDQVMTEKNTLSGRFFYSRAPTDRAVFAECRQCSRLGHQ
jgi:hypothetical protein